MITRVADVPETHEPGVDYRHLVETKKLASSLVSIRPGQKVPKHVHHDEEQTYYVLRGHGEIELGGEVSPLGPDTFVLIPLDTDHEVRNTGSEPLEYVYVVAFVPPKG